MPVLPPDADARRIFVEHLLDHSFSARLCCYFGLDDDPVSNVKAHLRLAPLSGFGLAVLLGEVSATILRRLLRLGSQHGRCKYDIWTRPFSQIRASIVFLASGPDDTDVFAGFP